MVDRPNSEALQRKMVVVSGSSVIEVYLLVEEIFLTNLQEA
jgi:hypothetical protein